MYRLLQINLLVLSNQITNSNKPPNRLCVYNVRRTQCRLFIYWKIMLLTSNILYVQLLVITHLKKKFFKNKPLSQFLKVALLTLYELCALCFRNYNI